MKLNFIYRFKIIKFLIIYMMIFALVNVTYAQSENLEFGVTKFSSISSPGEVDTYSFKANSGDSVNIKMVKTAGSLYPKITLFSPNGDIVKSDYSSSKSEISTNLPLTGTYTIIAENGYTGSAYTGDYSIFCQRVNNPGNINTLQFGVTKYGVIQTQGEIDTYSFTADYGDSVNIKMVKTASSLYPKITLYSPNGEIVKSDYDSSNSEISTDLPLAGTYTIIAENGYTGSAYTGDYSVFCQRVNNPGNTNTLQFGVTKSGVIQTPGEIDSYSFTADYGDSVNIKMVKTAGSLYPKITLFSPNGDIVKSDYDSSKSEISSDLPLSGTYTIIAENGYTGSAYTGDYSVFCQRVNNPDNINTLQFGVTKSGVIQTPGEIDSYSFTANYGDSVNIKMVKTAGSLYPKITLYSPNGDVVKSDYDSSKSEISTNLPLTGTYTIIAENGYTGSAYTGDYSIFVQRTSSGGISEPISEISPENSQENTQNTNASLSQLSTKFPLMNYILLFIIGVVLIMAVFAGGKYNNKRNKENKEKSKISDKENLGKIPSIGLPLGLKDKTKEPASKITKNDVFISYSSEDKPIADATCANLESKGIRCWIAPRDVLPGKNYQGEIIDAIDNTHIMVLIFSSNSNKSPYIIRELTEAVENDVVIIPFRIENILPSKSMKFLINVPHWLDAMTPPLEQHLEKLTETIRLFLNNDSEKGDDKT